MNMICNLDILLNYSNSKLSSVTYDLDEITSDLVDPDFLDEVKAKVSSGIRVYFGKTMRDLKFVIIDDDSNREHWFCVKYRGPAKLVVTYTELPQSVLQGQEYKSLNDVIISIEKVLDSFSDYFNELERIDRFCTIVEPVNPTFKDDYRRIKLDNRAWLHVEVTPEGLATNVHLVGQSELWQDKLQNGLLKWNHDDHIVENIMNVFGIKDFPTAANDNTSLSSYIGGNETKIPSTTLLCSICLCPELEELGVPQPICANRQCGVYFHSVCLFQWLVSSNNGRPPAFGVATGSCPSCLQPISCSEKGQ